MAAAWFAPARLVEVVSLLWSRLRVSRAAKRNTDGCREEIINIGIADVVSLEIGGTTFESSTHNAASHLSSPKTSARGRHTVVDIVNNADDDNSADESSNTTATGAVSSRNECQKSAGKQDGFFSNSTEDQLTMAQQIFARVSNLPILTKSILQSGIKSPESETTTAPVSTRSNQIDSEKSTYRGRVGTEPCRNRKTKKIHAAHPLSHRTDVYGDGFFSCSSDEIIYPANKDSANKYRRHYKTASEKKASYEKALPKSNASSWEMRRKSKPAKINKKHNSSLKPSCFRTQNVIADCAEADVDANSQSADSSFSFARKPSQDKYADGRNFGINGREEQAVAQAAEEVLIKALGNGLSSYGPRLSSAKTSFLLPHQGSQKARQNQKQNFKLRVGTKNKVSPVTSQKVGVSVSREPRNGKQCWRCGFSFVRRMKRAFRNGVRQSLQLLAAAFVVFSIIRIRYLERLSWHEALLLVFERLWGADRPNETSTPSSASDQENESGFLPSGLPSDRTIGLILSRGILALWILAVLCTVLVVATIIYLTSM